MLTKVIRMSDMEPIVPVKCTKCGQEKPDTEFGKDMSKMNGLTSWCKSCLNAKGKRIRTGTTAISHPGQYWDVDKQKWLLKEGKW